MRDMENVYHCEGSGKYQFRQEVPAEIQDLVGKTVIRRSLDSTDEDTIKQLAAGYAAEYEEIFQNIRDSKTKGVDAGIFSYVLHCLRDQI